MVKKNEKIFDVSKGNPYGDGRYYDYQEVNTWMPQVVEERGNHILLSIYHAVARRLVSHVTAKPGQRWLDIGCGTAISTLELLLQNPELIVLAIDEEEGMLGVAKYKFHKQDGTNILTEADDPRLLQYWELFRAKSESFVDQVRFHLGSFQDFEIAKSESFDGAIANQSLHWMDPAEAFKKLGELLKPGSSIVWNTASHFYNNATFPSAEFALRYNDFFGFVLDELAKSGIVTTDYKTLATPPHNLNSIKTISSKQGFETEQVATHLCTTDLQVFISQYIPALVKQLVAEEVDEAELEAKVQSAIAAAISKPGSLQDRTHKYDVNTIFISTKK